MKAALDRAKAGSLLDIYESVRAKQDDGLTLSNAAAEEIADRTIARYRTHIAAALRKQNFNLQDDEVIDARVLVRCINEKTGLEIDSLTPDGVLSAVDSMLSASLSNLLGVPVTTVQDIAVLKQALIDGAVEAVRSGRATKLISKAVIKKLRDRKAWKTGGVEDAVSRKKVLNRWYQKKYRKTHVGVWREA